MKIVFFGTSDFGIPSLEALKNSPHKILSIVTAPDRPAGRRLKLEPTPVKAWAVKNKISFLEFQKENSRQCADALKKLEADVFVVISFGVILSKEFLTLPKLLPLNVHASLLPFYRGPSPMQTALLNGDAETGVSVMRMAEKLDAGDVLLQKKISLAPEDDSQVLSEKLSELGAQTLLESLKLLETERAVFVPQDEKKVTWTKKIKKEHGHIDWSSPASQILNQIRAMAGWPGTFSFYEGKRILIIKASAKKSERMNAAPGAILTASSAEGICVAARDHALSIERLQAEGKKPMKAEDFLKGFSLKPGSVLE